MRDIEDLECSVRKLEDENSKLLREYESLKHDSERLVEEKRTLMEQCTQLERNVSI